MYFAGVAAQHSLILGRPGVRSIPGLIALSQGRNDVVHLIERRRNLNVHATINLCNGQELLMSQGRGHDDP